MQQPRLSIAELDRLLCAEFPQAFNTQSGLRIKEVWHGGARVERAFDGASLRPGGTISGPTIMMLADVTIYIAILATIGWVPLAVTTNLSVNFLRKPGPGALVAECRLVKVGKRLAVGEIAIRSVGQEDMVAHAVSTYSIPSRSADGDIIPSN
ncbi:MAG: PaaI family thioesterase [Proteobacteria bacterium]|nr:PaaI family thioesterase [Pseudomonadota bacterium]